MISRAIILKSILGDKEKTKIESILKNNLSMVDLDSMIVVNERFRDILIIKNMDRSRSIEILLLNNGLLSDVRDISVDAILDKISIDGIGHLESYEIKYLNEIKRLL